MTDYRATSSGPPAVAYRRRNLTTRQWEFQKVQSAAYYLSERSDATIAELVAMLVSMEDPPEMEESEFEQFQDNEKRLLLMLAEARPSTREEMNLKAERAIARLLRSFEEGEMYEESILGQAALSDLRCFMQADGP